MIDQKAIKIRWGELQFLIESDFLKDDDILALLWISAIDESGTHDDSSHVVVASVTASVGPLQKLISQWKEVLSGYGLTYFHAAEFNSGKGECAKLRKEKRDECVKALIKTASDHQLEYVAYVIERSIFESEISEYSLSLPVSIYDYLLACVISDLMIRGAVQEGLFGIHVSIESGCPLTHELSDMIMRAAARRRLPPISRIYYGDKSYDFFQVVDMIAYDTFKYFRNAINPKMSVRKSFQKIIEGNPFHPYLINRDWLRHDLSELNGFLNKLKER